MKIEEEGMGLCEGSSWNVEKFIQKVCYFNNNRNNVISGKGREEKLEEEGEPSLLD